MKKNILSLTAVVLMISACTDKPREEIVSRYNTGEKELVVIYQGTGENETVLSKTWYHKNGFQIKYQAFENGSNITKDFAELNTNFARAEGLFDYLSGKWVFWDHSDDRELPTSYRFNSLTSEPPVMEFSSNDSMIFHYNKDDPIEKQAFPMKLMNEFKYVMTVSENNQDKEFLINIEIISPDAMKMTLSDRNDDEYMIAFREESSELEAIKLKAMAEKAYLDRLLDR